MRTRCGRQLQTGRDFKSDDALRGSSSPWKGTSEIGKSGPAGEQSTRRPQLRCVGRGEQKRGGKETAPWPELQTAGPRDTEAAGKEILYKDKRRCPVRPQWDKGASLFEGAPRAR